MAAIVDPQLISLIQIRTLKGNMDIGTIPFIGNPGIYNFEFKAQSSIEREPKFVRFLLEINIININAAKEMTGNIASYTTEFVFKVENLEELANFDETSKSAQLDILLGTTLAGIAYSTMRGIIHMRTQGTVLDGIILPIINPANLVPQQVQPASAVRTP